MIINRLLKVTLSAMLVAGGGAVVAQGPVTLKDGKEKITWAQFVQALNNPTTVKGTVDPNSDVYKQYQTANQNLENEKKAQETADANLKTANTNLSTAKGKVTTAKEEQTTAANELTSAQNAYTTASEAYNAALGNQSKAQTQLNTLNEQLTTAQQNVTNAQAQIKEQITDVLTSKKAKLESNKEALTTATNQAGVYADMRDSYTQVTYEKVTAPWLVQAKADAEIFRNNFKLTGGTGDFDVYYKADVKSVEDIDENWNPITTTTVTLMISFVPQDGWNSNKVGEAFKGIPTKYPDIKPTTIINKVQIYLGYTDGKPNYGTNSVLTINPNIKYSQVGGNIADAIEGIDEKSYQVESGEGKVTITNQTQYDKYDALWKTEDQKVKDLTSANETLSTEISNLETKIETKNDPLYTQLETAQNEVKRLNGENGEIPTLKSKLAGYAATIETYTTTTYEEDGEEKSYIGANGQVVSYLNYLSYQQTLAQATKTAKDNAVSEALEEQTNAQNAVNTASTAATNAKNAVATAQTSYNTAKAAYDAAQEAADKAATEAAQEKYSEITLTADVTATEPITNAYSGTINGGGHIINVNITPTEGQTQKTLFSAFSGHVDNVAINGSLGSNLVGATFANVVRWDGNGKIYNETGVATEFNSNTLEDAFGAFGFAIRDNANFGVDFNGCKIVPTDAAPSKVFSLTAYDVPAGLEDTDPVATHAYVQLSEKESSDMVTLVNKEAIPYIVPQNRFAQSATADVAGKGLTNVYYGTNNTCDNVKIVDRENFYCPVPVKAKVIDYNRVFAPGYNSVCLPFQLTKGMSGDIISICEYESVDTDTKKFWFKQDDDSEIVKANTPVLIVTDKNATGEIKLSVENVEIAATNKNQLVANGAMYGEMSKSYGTLKKCNPTAFQGMQYVNHIYGLTADEGQFQAVGSKATLPAFRMVIGTNTPITATPNGDSNDIFSIGIHDENGEDITDSLFSGEISGVEEVISDAASFTVAGGHGQIIIKANADLGKVEVYNLNGMLIKVVDVTEGTNTVEVSTGLYIVKGQKVMVK